MAEPTWVGLGGLIASVFSAIAAYLAIRQTIIQRKIANKVQLITKNIIIHVPEVKSRNSIKIDRFSEIFKSKLPVINVGLGPAIKIEYDWVFDYEKSLISSGLKKWDSTDPNKNLDELNSGNYVYKYDKFGLQYIHILNNKDRDWIFRTEKYKDIDYILPWAVHKEEVKLDIPNLMLILLTRECVGDNIDIIDMFRSKQGPKLIIRYEDITGTKTTNIFISTFKNTNVKIGDNGYDMEFTLTIAPVQSKTAVALERIRRRYTAIFR
ncbi:hypothetical protein G8S19_05230 [Citrobacter sp. SX206]|uniref:hypothetical protein n=1 Tax=unclassified Citrobacter TaxID=2644389 RepID=UPI0020A2A87E|nr:MULTISPECIES: hypothetical protein [unclassified Citrobacter]UTD17877.1 hypothetical protein G8S19_05230 [Citrobacter sp. SX206]UTD22168.1 hypothetical protein G8S20_05230 [Citrobacter sp. SX212]